MKYIRIGIGFILSLFYLGCSIDKSDNILLQSGNYKLTVADYEYLKSRSGKQPTDPQFAKQMRSNAYILAYAMDNRFDTIKVLARKLDCAERRYTSDIDGYVWNRKVKPLLKVSSDDIEKAYAKRDAQYFLEYIYFPDSISVNRYVAPGLAIESTRSFNKLKEKVASCPEVKSAMFRGTYPFYPFGVYTDRIVETKKGDVVGPFKALGGYYVLRVAGVEPVKQRSFAEEKAKIEKELLDALKLKFIFESQCEVLGSIDPVMHDSTINLMAEKFIARTKQWPGISGDMVLMDYRFKNKVHHYTATDFMEFIRYQPMYVGSPGNANDMKKMMTNFLMEVWYYDEALRMGAEMDEEFLCFKKYYQSKLFVGYYNEKSIYANVRLSPGELKEYYDENHDEFQYAEVANISIYKFRNQQASFKAMMPLTQYYKNKLVQEADSTLPKLQGLSSFLEDVKFQISDTTNSNMLVDAILDAEPGRVLSPREINGEYWIVYLDHKNGSTLLPFKYAKGKLQYTLLDQKTRAVRDRLLLELKSQYPIKIDRIREYIKK
nr:peptidylprolyl isomerase [uncultured Draconibacterium sp.]